MKILCFGDSNTFGYDPRSAFGSRYSHENRWVDIIQTKTGWDLINGGQNGREIPHRSFELASFQELIDRHTPDRLLVMLGTNDLLQGVGLNTIAVRMETFLQQVPCPVVLIAPPPLQRGAWVEDDTLSASSCLLAETYRLLAERLQIPFIDSGVWGIELTFDGVHFSESGHRIFADHLIAALDTLPR